MTHADQLVDYRESDAPGCLQPADTRWAKIRARVRVWSNRRSWPLWGWALFLAATLFELFCLTEGHLGWVYLSAPTKIAGYCIAVLANDPLRRPNWVWAPRNTP